MSLSLYLPFQDRLTLLRHHLSLYLIQGGMYLSISRYRLTLRRRLYFGLRL